MKVSLSILAAVTSIFMVTSVSLSWGDELCFYTNKEGVFTQVKGRTAIPEEYRHGANCIKEATRTSKPKEKTRSSSSGSRSKRKRESAPAGQNLVAPGEVTLDGTTRRESLSTPLGRMNLRWPRSLEKLFGRNPLRAMTGAATTVSRTLRRVGFPQSVRTLEIDWEIVFIDNELPEKEIPAMLRQNCHPGWMTPPSNIYIVGQRVAGACYGRPPQKKQVADSQLEEVLVHELGHAVEYFMLRKVPPYSKLHWNRMRKEGFATWFETIAAPQSALLNEKKLEERNFWEAKQAIQRSPNAFVFGGTSYDYSRASMYFQALEAKRGVRGVMDVYDVMIKKQLNFFDAIDDRYNWNTSRLEKEVRRLLK